MEKLFKVLMPNGREQIVTESLANQLLSKRGINQVKVLGEVVESGYRKKGDEDGKMMSDEEFRKKHISYDTLPNGRRIRKVDKGYEIVYKIDENGRPNSQFDHRYGASKERGVITDPYTKKEISREEWERRRR